MKSITAMVLVSLALAAACGGDDPANTEAPAKVENPVKETDLTTVTLSAEAERRLGIATVAVEERAVPPTRTFGGEIIAPPGRSFPIAAPVTGTVMAPAGGAMPVPGTPATRGQALLRLVPLPPETDLVRGEEELRIAEAKAEQMRSEAARAEELARDSLIAQRDLERIRTELVTAETALQGARARLERQRTGTVGLGPGVTALTIASPQSGVIIDLTAGAGQVVAAGAPLITVASMDKLWVKAPIFSGEAAQVPVGAQAQVDLLQIRDSASSIPARRVTAPPTADPASSSVDLFFELAQSEGLRPGQRVSITITLKGQSMPRLVVPLSAIVYDQFGGSWVYVKKQEHKYVRERVEVERAAGEFAVLARGPAPGALVVATGVAELFGTEFGAGK